MLCGMDDSIFFLQEWPSLIYYVLPESGKFRRENANAKCLFVPVTDRFVTAGTRYEF